MSTVLILVNINDAKSLLENLRFNIQQSNRQDVDCILDYDDGLASLSELNRCMVRKFKEALDSGVKVPEEGFTLIYSLLLNVKNMKNRIPIEYKEEQVNRKVQDVQCKVYTVKCKDYYTKASVYIILSTESLRLRVAMVKAYMK